MARGVTTLKTAMVREKSPKGRSQLILDDINLRIVN
jgi:hypothetical protein